MMFSNQLTRIIKKHKLEAFTTEATDSYFNHTTLSINSLSDYITLISAFATLNEKYHDMSWVYRGCSNSSWKLEPSLVRRIRELPMGYHVEHDLAVDFRSEIPELFHNTQTNFEKIAKMQHFGVPTRLLDFSLNPLVALYFACSENLRTPGRVVFSYRKIHHYDDPCVECVSSLYLYEDSTGTKVDDWVKPYNMSVSDYLFNTYTDLLKSSPMFVKPLYLDERMKVQRSVFLLFHNYVRDLWADRLYFDNVNINREKAQYEQRNDIGYIYEAQIDNPYISFREKPLLMLDKLSFDRLTDFYRELDIDRFDEATATAFSSRFILQDDIQPIDMYDIWNSFASIIIPPKCKKTVLTQLENIGIDEAYVYPEPEYLARRIKRLNRGI